MEIDDIIKDTLKKEIENIDLDRHCIDTLWNSVEQELNSHKKSPLSDLLHRIRFSHITQNAVECLGLLAIIIVIFAIPFTISYFNNAPSNTYPSNKSVVEDTTPSIIDKAGNNLNTGLRNIPEIVLYNSHTNETYNNGSKISDVSELLKKKLNAYGFSCSYIINNDSMPKNNAYDISRDLIINSINDYKNKILLDIHIASLTNSESDNTFKEGKKITVVLGKTNPGYEKNKIFADLIVNQIKQSSNIPVYIEEWETGFNQDLSNNALLIEIGNNSTNDVEILNIIDALASSFRNIFVVNQSTGQK